MPPGILIKKSESHSIRTPLFEGPLDLLLQLIEKSELDITKLSLAQVTDQYLRYIHTLVTHASEEISEFLVIASKLIQIKSAALLPYPTAYIENEEDIGDQLVKQLIEYRRYKNAALYLTNRQEQKLRSYLRLNSSYDVEPIVDLSNISIDDLLLAARHIFYEYDKDLFIKQINNEIKISLRQKINQIAQKFRETKQVIFWELVKEKGSRLDVVVTFIAVLELIKQHLVTAYQNSLFDDINLKANESWDFNETIELEFGE